MSKFDITSISDPLDVGTRIHWDEEVQSVYFVDVPNSMVYKYNVTTNKTTKAKVGNEPLAFMFPVVGSNTKFIAGLGRKFVFVDWDGESSSVSKVETIAEVETEVTSRENRLNGGKVDPCGRLWAGTMGPRGPDGNIVPGRGALYSLEKGVLKKHISDIGISNGLAWDVERKKMYYIDTLNPGVFQYDISNSGVISNKTVVFDFDRNDIEGQPDGLTIDTEGNLWVCSIYGSTVVRFDPRNGKVLDKIVFPTSQPTSITFGGSDLDQLFVTTARIEVGGNIPPNPAGKTFLISSSGCFGCKGKFHHIDPKPNATIKWTAANL
ncbi:hypothetical protein JTB14_010434 [Gonioctena quinquepunctata]|nr:hypothetical protein JTB14_010434 [Gonioctena quinquepunctata]